MNIKNINLGKDDIAYIAMAVRLQIDNLSEALEQARSCECVSREDRENIADMLTEYRRIYKLFDQYTEVVDRFLANMDN